MIIAQIFKTMGHLDTLKIYGVNAVAFLSTLTTLDIVLKRSLLVASLAYTLVKLWKLIVGDRKKPKSNEE